MQTSQLLALAAGLISVASAHMEMTYPAPFKSKSNPNAGQDIDYAMTSPLNADGSNFPCKGYHSLVGTDAGKPTADFAPGQSYEMKIAGGANHNGGSCQASLSYDKGKTWTVIHSYIGNCPVSGESSYPFTVPSDAPGGEAIFAWTWFNKVGNREMYMNCAAVNIGGGSGSAKRQSSSAFSSRPAMFVANVGNGCKVLETTDVDFPNPGPDVSVDPAAAKKAPEGDCGSGGGSGAPSTPENPPQQPAPSSAAPQPPQQPTQQPPQQPPQQPTQQPPQQPAPSSAAPQPPAVPTTIPGNVFITVPPAASTPVAAPVPTASPSTLLTLTKSGVAPVPTPGKPSVPTTPQPTPVPGNGGAGAIAAGTPCDKEGLWNCVGGSQFQRCASGQWSVLQAMASGLTCVPGQSDSLSFKKRAPRGFWWV